MVTAVNPCPLTSCPDESPAVQALILAAVLYLPAIAGDTAFCILKHDLQTHHHMLLNVLRLVCLRKSRLHGTLPAYFAYYCAYSQEITPFFTLHWRLTL